MTFHQCNSSDLETTYIFDIAGGGSWMIETNDGRVTISQIVAPSAAAAMSGG